MSRLYGLGTVWFSDMHKASPYDLWGIFAHTQGPVATVGTCFMHVRTKPQNGISITPNCLLQL